MANGRVFVGPGLDLAPRKPRYTYGRVERWVVSSVAFALHACSILYLVCFAGVYYVVPADQVEVLLLFAPRMTAVVFMLLALLHVYGAALIVFPHCINPNILMYDPSRPPSSWLGKLKHLYIRCLSRHGLFGLHGEFYDVRVAIKHLTQVSFQAYEARAMSLYLTHPGACTTYTVILAAGCFAVPCMLYSPNQLVHRWGADSVYNFALTAGAPLILLFRAIVDYYFSGNNELLWNREWLNQMIMLARAVSVHSPLDLVSSSFLALTYFISLKNLHAAVHTTHM